MCDKRITFGVRYIFKLRKEFFEVINVFFFSFIKPGGKNVA